MEQLFSSMFAWIGAHESVLSGMVAIAVLTSLAFAGLRTLGMRGRIGPPDSLTNSASSTDADRPLIDQQIRYCQTSDGARIAYAVAGEGTPIVRVLGWFSHLEVEWSSPIGRGFWQRLAREHRLIRYDGRGMGLSEPTREFSSATRLSDLEAVVEANGLDRFALVALSEGTRTAVRYAVKHPERVSHLILYGSNIFPPETISEEMVKEHRAMYAMAEAGWGKETHLKFFADLFLGRGASPEEVEFFAEIQNRSATRDVASAYMRSMAERDNGFELAARITTPTLIMHPKDDQVCAFQNSIDLAAEIPGAQLKPLNGDCHFLMLNSARSHSQEYIEGIETFLREN